VRAVYHYKRLIPLAQALSHLTIHANSYSLVRNYKFNIEKFSSEITLSRGVEMAKQEDEKTFTSRASGVLEKSMS
jgi:hypothetical protein